MTRAAGGVDADVSVPPGRRGRPGGRHRRRAGVPDAAADARRSGGGDRGQFGLRRRTSPKFAPQLGLDRPIAAQFFIWAGKMATGDFGESFFYKKTVASLILDRLEPTLALARRDDLVGDADLRAAGDLGGASAGLLGRPDRDGLLRARFLGAGVRDRLSPDLCFFRPAGLVSGAGLPTAVRRLRRVPLSVDPALDHAFHRLYRAAWRG